MCCFCYFHSFFHFCILSDNFLDVNIMFIPVGFKPISPDDYLTSLLISPVFICLWCSVCSVVQFSKHSFVDLIRSVLADGWSVSVITKRLQMFHSNISSVLRLRVLSTLTLSEFWSVCKWATSMEVAVNRECEDQAAHSRLKLWIHNNVFFISTLIFHSSLFDHMILLHVVRQEESLSSGQTQQSGSCGGCFYPGFDTNIHGENWSVFVFTQQEVESWRVHPRSHIQGLGCNSELWKSLELYKKEKSQL